MEFEVDTNGERIDAYLARVEPKYSRSFWQKLCESGNVLLNDKAVKNKKSLNEGDKLKVIIPDIPTFADQELPIIFENADVIVINKPSGILTHAKGEVSEEFTIADFVRPKTTDNPEGNRPGIVHRLDRDTSGVIIAAKNNKAKTWLQKQFSQRRVKKTYLALVEGQPKESAAIINLPTERNPAKPQTFRVNRNGKPAETTYETVKIMIDLL